MFYNENLTIDFIDLCKKQGGIFGDEEVYVCS